MEIVTVQETTIMAFCKVKISKSVFAISPLVGHKEKKIFLLYNINPID